MSKQNKIARLTSPNPKARGRTAKTIEWSGEIGEKGAVNQTKRTEASRPTGKSSSRGGKNRGDRRDMSPTYTGSARHSARTPGVCSCRR